MAILFRDLPDGPEIVRMGLRLLTALVIGGCIGLQRELTHHSAGFRTHILVAMGSALLVIAGSQSGMSSSDVSRVIQGIVTGIGFLGGGAILKITDERQILGLTTAAGIWMTAAASIAAGLGRIITALIALLLTLIVLGGVDQVRRTNAQTLSRRGSKERYQAGRRRFKSALSPSPRHWDRRFARHGPGSGHWAAFAPRRTVRCAVSLSRTQRRRP